MSERLSRLYSWLQANGVVIIDFSTDQSVQREMPKLVKLQTELHELRNVSPLQYLDHLADDLAALMRRVPSARVAPSTRRR